MNVPNDRMTHPWCTQLSITEYTPSTTGKGLTVCAHLQQGKPPTVHTVYTVSTTVRTNLRLDTVCTHTQQCKPPTVHTPRV